GIAREDRLREGGSGLDEASETAPYLPSAGVTVTGHAHAPSGRPVPTMPVRIGIFRDRWILDKTLQIFGYRPPSGAGAARPFERIPLTWDRAFGGPGVPDNPAGIGAAIGSPSLPNIVDP